MNIVVITIRRTLSVSGYQASPRNVRPKIEIGLLFTHRTHLRSSASKIGPKICRRYGVEESASKMVFFFEDGRCFISLSRIRINDLTLQPSELEDRIFLATIMRYGPKGWQYEHKLFPFSFFLFPSLPFPSLPPSLLFSILIFSQTYSPLFPSPPFPLLFSSLFLSSLKGTLLSSLSFSLSVSRRFDVVESSFDICTMLYRYYVKINCCRSANNHASDIVWCSETYIILLS